MMLPSLNFKYHVASFLTLGNFSREQQNHLGINLVNKKPSQAVQTSIDIRMT